MSIQPTPQFTKDYAYINTEPSKTSQLPAKEADINTIVERFLSTGVMPPPVRIPLELEDLASAPNLQQLLQARAHMSTAWQNLPKALQEKVGAPDRLLSFFEDPDNEAYLRKNGFLPPKQEAAPPAPVVAPSQPAAAAAPPVPEPPASK